MRFISFLGIFCAGLKERSTWVNSGLRLFPFDKMGGSSPPEKTMPSHKRAGRRLCVLLLVSAAVQTRLARHFAGGLLRSSAKPEGYLAKIVPCAFGAQFSILQHLAGYSAATASHQDCWTVRCLVPWALCFHCRATPNGPKITGPIP